MNLKVTDSVRHQAVLAIYASLNIPVDGRLAVATLEQQWRNTGLRYADLLDAIDSMVDNELLDVRLANPALNLPASLLLTAKGYQEFLHPAGTIREKLSMHRTLRRARQRHLEAQDQPGQVTAKRRAADKQATLTALAA